MSHSLTTLQLAAAYYALDLEKGFTANELLPVLKKVAGRENSCNELAQWSDAVCVSLCKRGLLLMQYREHTKKTLVNDMYISYLFGTYSIFVKGSIIVV